MIFGSPNVGVGGTIQLSSLNGANGFKLDGEANSREQSGYSVSAAGDINGDGYVDLIIGAPVIPALRVAVTWCLAVRELAVVEC